MPWKVGLIIGLFAVGYIVWGCMVLANEVMR